MQVQNVFGFSDFHFTLHHGPDRKNLREIPSSRSRSVASLGLSHGDILYLHAAALDNVSTPDSAEAGPSNRRERQNSVSSVGTPVATTSKSNVEEDQIDVQLWTEDGKIQRGRTNYA